MVKYDHVAFRLLTYIFEQFVTMKIIEANRISDFAEHEALFFLNDGILVDCLSASPLLQFAKTARELEVIINRVFLDGKIVIVQCQSSLQLNQTYNNQFRLCPTKCFLTELDKEIQQYVLRAAHWLAWDTRYKYCSKCGGKLEKVLDITEKKCVLCHYSFFPNLSPAILVLIQREHEILLARSPHFRPGMYSAIAGFIELGETAEAAVHREVKEEVGLEISRLEYFGSQSWPFPNSFMIAFKAHYLRGDLIFDNNEIEHAQWFDLNNLPGLPSYPCIARVLIDSLLLEKKHVAF
jgi:NAD+ diphosphatase